VNDHYDDVLGDGDDAHDDVRDDDLDDAHDDDLDDDGDARVDTYDVVAVLELQMLLCYCCYKH